jgi:hypothetical protein
MSTIHSADTRGATRWVRAAALLTAAVAASAARAGEPKAGAVFPLQKDDVVVVDEGFRFVEWRDAAVGAENPITVTVDRPLRFHAVMAPRAMGPAVPSK